MIFTADIGNTCIKLYNRTSLICRVSHDQYEICLEHIAQHDTVIICSVKPQFSSVFINFLDLHHRETWEITSETPLFFSSSYAQGQCGLDRICGIAGVLSYYKEHSFILVDTGTATVFSVVVDNTLKGGFICPGLRTSFNALLQNAEKIPYIDMKQCNRSIQNNTEDAVCSGTVLVHAYGISGILSLIKEQYGSLPVFFTGGNISFLKEHILCEHIYDELIVSKGAYSLYEYSII